MRRWRQIALGTAGIVLVGAQMVRPERTNPPTDPSRTLAAKHAVPETVAQILDRACRDCHSNATRWPWYSHVAPASLLLAHDVREGRDEMNLSEWADYDAETMDEQLTEICKQVRDGAMPLRPYTWLHREASLSSRDVELLCAWTEQARAEVKARAE